MQLKKRSFKLWSSTDGCSRKDLVWISLFIAIAPMLGFLGTVIGMIIAFDKIEAVGDLSPSVVAGELSK
ncbi:MAG: MotA/TolQ/ExbB proton channel family protein [Saprospiraceae bacterium]